MCLSIMMAICAETQGQFMKKMSKTEAQLKKSVAYKKKLVSLILSR